MKILFQNREPSSWVGGDQIQLDKTRHALGKLGVKTVFSSDNIAEPEAVVDADVVHCFNFSMPWTKYQIWNARKLKKKVVCSMIYHETEQFVSYKVQQAMVNELNACIFLTEGERDRALRHLRIPSEKIHIIENGIDGWWFQPTTVELAKAFNVLTVGRVDENKGQLAVAKVCKKLGLSYCCIGEGSDYAELVRAEGATVLPPLPQRNLQPYYAACGVYALVSYKEVFPLTVMEAGSQKRNIILTSGCEWGIDKFVERANYNDEHSIEQALLKTLFRRPNTEFYEYLIPLSWDNVAKRLLTIYQSL